MKRNIFIGKMIRNPFHVSFKYMFYCDVSDYAVLRTKTAAKLDGQLRGFCVVSVPSLGRSARKVGPRGVDTTDMEFTDGTLQMEQNCEKLRGETDDTSRSQPI